MRSAFRSYSFVAVCLLFCMFVFVKVRQVRAVPEFISQSYALSWDNYGYYLYLPSTFIYNDLGAENRSWFDSLNKKYQPERPPYQYWSGQGNKRVNAYPSGQAIGYLPGFLLAHATAGWFGYERDGLSAPYQYAAILSCLLFGLIGFLLLRKILLRFFSEQMTVLLLLLIGMGTNLYYYATYDCNLPHIFLFAVDNAILLLTIRWHEKPRPSTAFYLGLAIGLATITRPTEIAWTLVPLFWNINGWSSFMNKVKMFVRQWKHVILVVAGMIAFGSIQLLYWKYTSGKWMSYNHVEGFDFLHPFTWRALFSYKKGWLLYTPMMILAIMGIFTLRKQLPAIFLPVLVFFMINLWLITSWECWWYAVTFGQRPFVQSYGLMAIPLGSLLLALKRKSIQQYIVSGIAILLLFFNQFQIWQFTHGIIDGSLMTSKYYWTVFGETKMITENKNFLEVDRDNVPPFENVKNQYKPFVAYENNYEPGSIHVENELKCDTVGENSTHCGMVNATSQFCGIYRSVYKDLTKKDHLRMRYTASFYTNELHPQFVTISFAMVGKRGQNYGVKEVFYDSTNLVRGKWVTFSAEYITPVILHDDDELLVDVFNLGGSTILVDNIKLEIFEPKE